MGKLYCYSFTQSCLTLCDPMNCSTPGFLLFHYIPEFTQTHVHWVDNTIQLSHPLLSPSPPALHLSQHQGFFFPVSRLFTSGDQNVGASASPSVLPKNIQGWFPLGLVWSPYCSRDSQDLLQYQFKSINFLVLMVRYHHWHNGHEFEQTPGDSGGQRSLACCSPWDCKELDTT